ncbi:unnamed protein product [Durusdinium trenchii]|uniref:Dehydrogenase/reductase SDR family member 12 (Short-chain dehydrogenase/reductase family 40C member 1) n=2 Tax=Durusdinium trenchii TaxID=1381693 RepID=A0ABP0SKB9_9DINO
MGFWQFAATTQFFLYGKRHFTSSGWEMHKATYEQPDLLSTALDLAGQVFIVTGANSGIGKEISQFLATKGATLYMVCRSKDRAEAARADIVAAAAGDSASRVHVLLADCSLEADVRRCWDEFCAHRMQQSSDGVHLNGLVCNAGALANTKTLTSENVEVTFAAHLLFGTSLLGTLAMPCLEATVRSRLVVVSSGGMYNTAFPKWEDATCTGSSKYDGQFAYAYAKRGQVLLCEEWAKSYPKVKVMSCHPGWTSTPGVDAAYGSSQSYLEPLRNLWQGAEGIIWLLVADAAKLQSGAFYLDREPQVKHMGGAFFTEGSVTKNSPGEVADMMRLLEDWANGRRDSATRVASAPLTAMERSIELPKFMGVWYVIANIPTFFDQGTSNNIETYSLDETGKNVLVDFTYQQGSSSKLLQQRAEVVNDACTQWAISPKIGVFIPLRLSYLIVDCAEDYSTCIIGVPDRRYLWIMARTPTIEEKTLEALISKSRRLGFDEKAIVRVPQGQ